MQPEDTISTELAEQCLTADEVRAMIALQLQDQSQYTQTHLRDVAEALDISVDEAASLRQRVQSRSARVPKANNDKVELSSGEIQACICLWIFVHVAPLIVGLVIFLCFLLWKLTGVGGLLTVLLGVGGVIAWRFRRQAQRVQQNRPPGSGSII